TFSVAHSVNTSLPAGVETPVNTPEHASPRNPTVLTGSVRANGASLEPLVLHDDLFFDPDPEVRRVARRLYEGTRDLPLICPHGHVDAQLLADNAPFPEPTALLV